MYDKDLMDSNEERDFYEWLLEAENAGLVSDIEYHEREFLLSDKATMTVEKQLKTKTKTVEKFLLHPHRYTPDFVFKWHGNKDVFVTLNDGVCYVDVKGGFSKFNDEKPFSINQKWVFEKFEIYVNKVIPDKLFKKTWCPLMSFLSPRQLKPRKKFIGCKTIGEYIGN